MRLKNAYKNAKHGAQLYDPRTMEGHIVGMGNGGKKLKYIPPTQGRVYSDNARVAPSTPKPLPTPQPNITKLVKDKDYQLPKYGPKKEINPTVKKLLNSADMATDVLQLGHFSPDPFMIGQTAGLIGDVVGAGVDAIQSGIDVYEGNYGNAALNLGLSVLPGQTKKLGYERPSSLLTGKGSGMYRPLTATTPALAQNPVIKKGLNWNRGTLAANLTELGSNTGLPNMPSTNAQTQKEYQDNLKTVPLLKKPGMQIGGLQKMPGGGDIKNNWFNRTFRDRQLMKQEILNENPVLKNVLNSDNTNIYYAKGSQRRLLEAAKHNPEYFDKDNNRNGVPDNQNDTDSGYPYKGDITLDNGVIRNPNPGEYTTLINKKGLNRQQVKNIATNDFMSHALHGDPTYQTLNQRLENRLNSRYGKGMVENNGGADAYVRGMVSNDAEYAPYKQEMQFLNPQFLQDYQGYLKTGKAPESLNTPDALAPGFKKGGKVDHSNDDDMVNGVASILRRVKDKKNRLQLANQLSNQFKREKVKYSLNDFLNKSKVKK